MGSINKKTAIAVPKIKGLRRRWFVNTFGVIATLGLACVLIVSALFAWFSYSGMEKQMRSIAKETDSYIATQNAESAESLFEICIEYTASFGEKEGIALQFLDANGNVATSSHVALAEQSLLTADVAEAMEKKKSSLYIGADSDSERRILALSSPALFGDDQLVGIFRYVLPTTAMDLQIGYIAIISLLTLVLVATVVLITSNYHIRSILVPLGEIIEKAKKITSGSYGIQIETKFDDEIGELADTINEMSIQINQNEKMQSEFISSLSHELRTPLTAITGWSETLLSSNDLTGDTRRGMKIIHREAGRLTEMVLELLDFTRIQDGRMTLNMELVDIRSEFEDVIYMYGSRLAQDGIQVKYLDSDVQMPEISCDPMRLRQVFLNILDNAAKHGSEGKQIETAINYTDNTVIVTIRDHGPGIPEDELPLVKKKFYKGSSKARGSGIGLAVCDEIVEMHGGSLTLENAADGGTLVTVELPVTQ